MTSKVRSDGVHVIGKEIKKTGGMRISLNLMSGSIRKRTEVTNLAGKIKEGLPCLKGQEER